jgi:hypothetical protein
MAVVTARRGTLRVVVRPLLFVLAAVIAAIIAAVIAAVIAMLLFRRSCWLVLSGADALISVRPYFNVLGLFESFVDTGEPPIFSCEWLDSRLSSWA